MFVTKMSWLLCTFTMILLDATPVVTAMQGVIFITTSCKGIPKGFTSSAFCCSLTSSLQTSLAEKKDNSCRVVISVEYSQVCY